MMREPTQQEIQEFQDKIGDIYDKHETTLNREIGEYEQVWDHALHSEPHQEPTSQEMKDFKNKIGEIHDEHQAACNEEIEAAAMEWDDQLGM